MVSEQFPGSILQIRQIQNSIAELKVKNEDQENNIQDIKNKIKVKFIYI